MISCYTLRVFKPYFSYNIPMSGIFVKTKKLILLVGDIALFYSSLFLSLLILRYNTINLDEWLDHVQAFSIIYLLIFIIFYINELYDLDVAQNVLVFGQKLAESILIGTVVAIGLFYFTPIFGITPKTNLFVNLATLSILITSWRLLFNRIYHGRSLEQNIILLGESREMIELKNILNKKPLFGFRLVNPKTEHLYNFVHENNINTIVIDESIKNNPQITKQLYALIQKNVHVIDCLSFYEEVLGRIPTSSLDELWFVQNFNETGKKLFDQAKKIIDMVGGALMTIILTPIIVMVWIAISLDDGGPLFYRQTRVGKSGKLFRIIKFRTMRVDAEKDGAQFAAENDPRITRVGHFLRRYRLDELPQVFNILRNDMSFIGPRPERPEFTKDLEAAFPFYPLRFLVKPGLTGWAQVRYSYGASIEENLKKLQYDFFYIKHRSFALETIILLRTFNLLLHPKGR